MTTCPQCAHSNPETARYCNACGGKIEPSPSTTTSDSNWAVWKQFIGHRAAYYIDRFHVFHAQPHAQFVLTWHWPAFAVGWLWYLYRKMYIHAVVFLIGGTLPMLLGAGVWGLLVWNLLGAISANFLYYIHVKTKVAAILQQAGSDTTIRDRLFADAGGIQPYVWWLGIGLMAFAFWTGYSGITQAPPPSK